MSLLSISIASDKFAGCIDLLDDIDSNDELTNPFSLQAKKRILLNVHSETRAVVGETTIFFNFKEGS